MRLLSALTTLAIAATTTAQTVSLETATNIGVFGKTANAADLQFLKKGTRLGRQTTISANVGRVAAARTVATLGRTTEGLRAQISEVGRATGAGATAGTTDSDNVRSFSAGPHSFTFKVGIAKDRKVKVIVRYAGRASDGAKAAGAVDLNGDNKFEFEGTADGKMQEKSFEVTAGDNGISITLQTNALAAGSERTTTGEYTAVLSVTVGESAGDGRCRFVRYGTVCGPVMAGQEAQSTNGSTIARFRTTGAQANALALFIMGVRKVNLRLPNSRCFLSALPIITFGRQTARDGSASIEFLVPNEFQGSVETQDVILFRTRDGFGIQSTNGLTLACRAKQ